MKLVSFGDPGSERPGVVDRGAQIVDLLAIRSGWPQTWRRILEADLWGEIPAAVAEARERGAVVPLGSVRLGPPIVDPSKIIAVGLNYRAHAVEQGKEPPARPLLFAKAPSCLVGPNDPIHLPDPALEDRVDAEAELCVVIGRRVRGLSESEAESCILGYTVMNDVSGRGAQYSDKQWFRGKSFDTFAPCGPWIVTRDELPDPTGLSLRATWNDRVMQDGRTDDLIFSIPYLIAYASATMTLEPGDLISTGTPSGVGVFREPQVFLQRGDTVRIDLENIGSLINPVV
ncbi:MAG: fumarylacetoacetate hydrolase family protein [Candidatus Eisenbacteria bacterium]|uniref:Fumarylacetoacetate hydrolase family protein n=1 Tax=Eiseniibacteriota bacterium TaxID=2212470 RepID=A0A956LYP8_UNCEI|nr:fumarylacetoacetate hydrolase family protein [Candidatus Eisenbacteria bacterium]